MLRNISELITETIRTVGIAGHVHPDGDCVGSCTALWQYLRNNFTQLSTVDLYLEPPTHELCFLAGVKEAAAEPKDVVYDLFITCDVSSPDRIAVGRPMFESARKTACIDHHATNPCFADTNHVEPDASSCAEVLTGLMDPEKIDEKIAESLYTGIIHDTGVFQYSNTSPRTLRFAADLVAKGVDASRIIDDSFNKRTYAQGRMLGYVLENAELREEGKVITAFVTLQDMADHGVTKADIGIEASQMRVTEGCEAAVFAYEVEPGTFKISLRSNTYLDVAECAQAFGGGGHAKAAGCTLTDTTGSAALAAVTEEIAKHLR